MISGERKMLKDLLNFLLRLNALINEPIARKNLIIA
jgi:hypothetical protein